MISVSFYRNNTITSISPHNFMRVLRHDNGKNLKCLRRLCLQCWRRLSRMFELAGVHEFSFNKFFWCSFGFRPEFQHFSLLSILFLWCIVPKIFLFLFVNLLFIAKFPFFYSNEAQLHLCDIWIRLFYKIFFSYLIMYNKAKIKLINGIIHIS